MKDTFLTYVCHGRSERVKGRNNARRRMHEGIGTSGKLRCLSTRAWYPKDVKVGVGHPRTKVVSVLDLTCLPAHA